LFISLPVIGLSETTKVLEGVLVVKKVYFLFSNRFDSFKIGVEFSIFKK